MWRSGMLALVSELVDHAGMSIRLSDERSRHILDHPEMANLVSSIQLTLADPEHVVQSTSDENVRLYYRSERTTRFGPKFICVVVKVQVDDAFVVTAYLTDQVKRGASLWRRS